MFYVKVFDEKDVLINEHIFETEPQDADAQDVLTRYEHAGYVTVQKRTYKQA